MIVRDPRTVSPRGISPKSASREGAAWGHATCTYFGVHAPPPRLGQVPRSVRPPARRRGVHSSPELGWRDERGGLHVRVVRLACPRGADLGALLGRGRGCRRWWV